MPPGQSGFVSAPCLRRLARHVTRTSQIRSRCSPSSSTRTRCSASRAPRRRRRPGCGSSATSTASRASTGTPRTTCGGAWATRSPRTACSRSRPSGAPPPGRSPRSSARRALEDDIVARRDFYTQAEREQMIESLPGDLRTRWQAYADGVNAWIDEVNSDPSKMPAEYAALGTHARAAPGARDGGDRHLPGAHDAERRRRGAGEPRGLPGGRAEGLRPRLPAAHAGPVGNGAATRTACSRRGPGATRKSERQRVQALVEATPSGCRCRSRGGVGVAARRRSRASSPRSRGSKMWAMRKLGPRVAAAPGRSSAS